MGISGARPGAKHPGFVGGGRPQNSGERFFVALSSSSPVPDSTDTVLLL